MKKRKNATAESFDGFAEANRRWLSVAAGPVSEATIATEHDDALRGDAPGPEELVARLASLPEARGIERLRFGMTAWDGQTRRIVGALIEAELPSLRSLSLGELLLPGDAGPTLSAAEPGLPPKDPFAEFAYPSAWSALGKLGELFPAFPALDSLVLRGTRASFGAIDAPLLRGFKLQDPRFSRAALRSVMDASWPNLERLELWFNWRGRWNVESGDEDHGDDGLKPAIKELSRLLAGKDLPRLASVSLRWVDRGDELLDALCASPLLQQLRRLDLSHITVGAPGVATLIDSSRHFARIEELVLAGVALTDVQRAAIARALPAARFER